ncbi:sn-glycerol-3-phosphate ABC transporter ATP-binding protein UgpC [bacterium]|nr:sn-glycerol-3-phosphate ABC transporter ATP-binding protein UgpC [candidate division CSSED10-310 bacterium]
MAHVVFKNVFKYFDNNMVVNNFNFEVKDKEFVVIVGPSGCGKSTTLRMVAGLESISDGEIRIGDRVINDVSPKDRDIAMVFQNYALYPHMDVYKNMAFGLKLRNVPADEIARRVQRAAEILGIEELLQRKPKQLSGGQRQRVAVGRAIVREPAVFLFDEPLSNLDAKLRVQMRAEIKKLHERLRTTMMYVTHDQVEAMTMGDRIVILKDGVLQQAGAPLDVYRYPENIFVAGFIGSPSMNLLPVTVSENMVLCGSSRISVQGVIERIFDLSTTSGYRLGIRPEDFVISKSGNADPDTAEIRGIVELIETTGSETLIHFNSNGIYLVAKLGSDLEIPSDNNISLNFPLKKIHMFDDSTEKSVRRKL